MMEITHTGCKLLLARRMSMAMGLSIVAQFFLINCAIFATNLSVTHPLSWLGDAWAIMTRMRVWCYFCILTSVVLVEGVINNKKYLSVTPCQKSRYDVLRGIFTPNNLMLGGLRATIGILLVCLNLSLENDERDDDAVAHEHCITNHSICITEKHYFLLLGGFWTGLYYFLKKNFSKPEYLEFLVMPQTKFVRMKRGIEAALPSSAIDALRTVLYFCASYYFLRSYYRESLASAFFLEIADVSHDDGFFGPLGPTLMLRSWLYAALYILTMNTIHLLFRICLVERTTFEIASRSRAYAQEEETSLTLAEALTTDSIPVVQHLAYLDLVTIAQKDKGRRAELFSLSQPGGHPYNWNRVVEACLGLLAKFTNDINEICSAKKEETTRFTDKPLVDPLDKHYIGHMRNLIDANATTMTATTTTTKSEADTNEPPVVLFIIEYFKNKRNNFIAYLLSKPLIFYFFGKQSDNNIRHVLAKGQTVVWAADAISSLAVVSLSEDSYGVVQKNLSDIIENLFHLKQALDKLQKTNVLMRKSQNDDKTIKMILTALRMATKRSIYRIVGGFENYIDDISLPVTLRSQLENFLVYKE